MNSPFNPNPVNIKLTHSELLELYKYLNECNIKGFVNTNNYTRINPQREYYIRFNLKEIAYKVYMNIMKIASKNPTFSNVKPIKLVLTQQEQHTLSILFKRVECSAIVTSIQQSLLINLTKM